LVFGGLLPYRLVAGTVVPAFLGEQDWPWLRRLLDEREGLVGRPRRELDERLRTPLPDQGPPGKTRLALHVLAQLGRSERDAVVPSPQARRLVFVEAAGTGEPRALVLARVAATLGVAAERLDAALFADLPGERLVAELPDPVSPGELALRANLALAQALLFRAAAVAIDAEGNARALVRHAKLGGLICSVAGRAPDGDVRLEVSGPFAVFRHTLLYGRALGRLVPLLAWCRRFRLRATCVLDGSRFDLELRTGDPIFPAAEPRRYDSRIEARFAREFRRLAPDWDVIREPEPVAAGPSLVFPDFALQHRHEPSRRWLVEIVGFWTPEYVRRKLALYRAARIAKLILCIDEERACADDDLPAGALVVRFRRHVDAEAVRRLVERPVEADLG
jgi:predicted nuclease of restriction endonuclease-like RecB superfamily